VGAEKLSEGAWGDLGTAAGDSGVMDLDGDGVVVMR
jgi:hypothetical protein